MECSRWVTQLCQHDQNRTRLIIKTPAVYINIGARDALHRRSPRIIFNDTLQQREWYNEKKKQMSWGGTPYPLARRGSRELGRNDVCRSHPNQHTLRRRARDRRWARKNAPLHFQLTWELCGPDDGWPVWDLSHWPMEWKGKVHVQPRLKRYPLADKSEYIVQRNRSKKIVFHLGKRQIKRDANAPFIQRINLWRRQLGRNNDKCGKTQIWVRQIRAHFWKSNWNSKDYKLCQPAIFTLHFLQLRAVSLWMKSGVNLKHRHFKIAPTM